MYIRLCFKCYSEKFSFYSWLHIFSLTNFFIVENYEGKTRTTPKEHSMQLIEKRTLVPGQKTVCSYNVIQEHKYIS